MCKTLAVSWQSVSQRWVFVKSSSHFKDEEIRVFLWGLTNMFVIFDDWWLWITRIHIHQLSPSTYFLHLSPEKKSWSHLGCPESLESKAEEIGSCLNGFFGALIDIITSCLDFGPRGLDWEFLVDHENAAKTRKTGKSFPLRSGITGVPSTSRCVNYERVPRCMKCSPVHEGSTIAAWM